SAPGQALPFMASSGWGILVAEEDEIRIECTGGHLDVQSLTILGIPWEPTEIAAIRIEAGEALVVRGSGTELRNSDRRVTEAAW
ncbi:MAG: hypothetical protein QOD52_1710, partial [Gaiellaceae bacterium]|nr:hypothetical protein [Gaiellaceae bacterium]